MRWNNLCGIIVLMVPFIVGCEPTVKHGAVRYTVDHGGVSDIELEFPQIGTCDSRHIIHLTRRQEAEQMITEIKSMLTVLEEGKNMMPVEETANVKP